MSWLALYGMAGLVTLLLVLGQDALSGIRLRPRAMVQIDPDPSLPPSWREWIVGECVVPILAAVLVVAVWSVVPAKMMLDMPRNWRQWRRRERPFRIRRKDLKHAYARAEVESRECVYDPLGAVPPLAFGHLNAAWRQFADAMEPETRFHAFRVLSNPRSYRPIRREGYVVVDRLGRTGAYFVATRANLGEP